MMNWSSCEWGMVISAAIVALGFAFFPHAIEAQEQSKPKLLTVITMGDDCAQCKQVKQKVFHHGGKFRVSTQETWPSYPDPATGRMTPVPYFPFCYYSDGTWSDGNKFLQGYAGLPDKPVTMIYYHTREGN